MCYMEHLYLPSLYEKLPWCQIMKENRHKRKKKDIKKRNWKAIAGELVAFQAAFQRPGIPWLWASVHAYYCI